MAKCTSKVGKEDYKNTPRRTKKKEDMATANYALELTGRILSNAHGSAEERRVPRWRHHGCTNMKSEPGPGVEKKRRKKKTNRGRAKNFCLPQKKKETHLKERKGSAEGIRGVSGRVFDRKKNPQRGPETWERAGSGEKSGVGARPRGRPLRKICPAKGLISGDGR